MLINVFHTYKRHEEDEACNIVVGLSSVSFLSFEAFQMNKNYIKHVQVTKVQGRDLQIV